MQITKVDVKTLQLNPTNPRIIRDDKFRKLVKSIKEFPEMLDIRPIVVDEDMVILGGNMRYKACVEAGLKEVPIIQAKDLTLEQKNEFIIKDNVGFGEWDWAELANSWDEDQLTEWGLDLPVFDAPEEQEGLSDKYTKKIEAPIYEPKGEKPAVPEMMDASKQVSLSKKIDSLSCPDDVKAFLRLAAQRFNVFNYSKIAEFYAHSDEEIQDIMEELALVIVDFDKAIECGFVKMSEDIANTFNDE